MVAKAEQQVHIQTSSHVTADAAISMAQGLAPYFGGLSVYRTAQGFYAVATGRLRPQDAETILARVRQIEAVPQDAYATDGTRFIELVWSPERPTLPMTDRTLSIEGPINAFTALNFERAIQANRRPAEILLDSPGGDVMSALMIARRIYGLGVRTRVAPDAVCASACALVFAAGQTMRADGLIGVHQIWIEVESNAATQFFLAEILSELDTYGAPSAFVDAMLRTRSDEMYFFSEQEMVQFGWR